MLSSHQCNLALVVAILAVSFLGRPTLAFTPPPRQPQQLLQSSISLTQRSMLPSFNEASLDTLLFTPTSNLLLVEKVFNNNLLLATIDSDIDSIPDDQFGLVFAGGIVVILGGILSAVFVGFLLEKGDLYASLAAESYLQSADDEEFWKGLSEEERKKTQEMLEKIKASKNNGAVAPSEVAPTTGRNEPALPTTAAASSSATKAPKEEAPTAAPATDMFSDYGD